MQFSLRRGREREKKKRKKTEEALKGKGEGGISSQFPRGQKAIKAQDPTESLATQVTCNCEKKQQKSKKKR